MNQDFHASWKVLDFFLDFSRPWKISLVLESPGNESLSKVLENEDPG